MGPKASRAAGVQRRTDALALDQLFTDPTIIDGVLREVEGRSRRMSSKRVAAIGAATFIGMGIVGWGATDAAAKGTSPPPTLITTCSGYYALTYDDGPSPMTPQYISKLASLGVNATFFVIGSNVNAYPAYTQQIATSGNWLGNHTMTHPDLTTLDAADRESEILGEHTLVDPYQSVNLVRPPYGATNLEIRQQIQSWGLAQTMWSVDTNDWQATATRASITKAALTVNDGGIILMHDNHVNTLNAVSDIVTGLKSQKGLCPGKIVRSPGVEHPTIEPGFTMDVVAVKP